MDYFNDVLGIGIGDFGLDNLQEKLLHDPEIAMHGYPQLGFTPEDIEILRRDYHGDEAMGLASAEPRFGSESSGESESDGAGVDSSGVRFGAGTCSSCGGLGYTTWPSGSEEACWSCNGSGVAH
jgi:hypothetical protein